MKKLEKKEKIFQICYFRQMKLSFLLTLVLLRALPSIAQDDETDRIAQTLPDDQILAPLRFLASDRLRGRHIEFPEIDTAAAYIAGEFRNAGAKPVPGNSNYYQLFYHPFTRHDILHMDQQIATYITPSTGRGIPIKNVLAVVPGSDPRLRNQYIVLSAHYDHAGVAPYAITEEGKLDSIFNGARDNATGVAGVIAAARYFAKYPPRRSVLFICYSAEEEGEIGSNYYAQHPLIPLNRTVFNLNIDNAGYDTTHAISLFGLGRTSADSLVRRACFAYRLTVLPEPGGQDLFARSDNYSLARQGIPAPNFSLGMKSWDSQVERHYHRRSDEVGNMDLGYVVRFIRAYILSAQYIANDPARPKWTPGDAYEANWRKLFGK